MAVAQPAAEVKRPSRLQRWWSGISVVFDSRVATVGLAIVAFWLIVGIISIWWTPFPPNTPMFEQFLQPNLIFIASVVVLFLGMIILLSSSASRNTKVAGLILLMVVQGVVVLWQLQGASPNMLGTDNLGRDSLSRLMTGTQVILLKTRLPNTSFGNLFLLLASLPALLSVLIFSVVLSKVIGNRVRLFILLGLWIAAGIILTQVANNAGLAFPGTENLALWQTLAITFGIIYVLVFAFGWLRSKQYKIRDEMKTWTWSIAIMIVLGLISIPLQSVEFSTVWPPMVIPIGVAIWGVIGSLVLGSILGLNAGYKGGWWDQSIMQGLDALIAFPVIVLYLVIIASVEQQTDFIIILAVTITGAPGVARLVRSLTLDIKTRDYIQAAETRGESANYVMIREILPNARGPILVDAMLRVGYAIFAIGTLGFLGLGLPPPDPDWGTMVADARQFIFAYPVGVVWPAIAIASLVIGLNLFADGMREELTRYQK